MPTIPILTKSAVAKLRRTVRKVDTMSGANVVNTPDRIVVGSPQQQPVRRGGAAVSPAIPAKITAIGDSDGQYEATEQIWDDSESEWIDKPEGRAWDGGEGNLAQLYEANGLAGVPVGTLVIVRRTTGDEGATVWWFDSSAGTSQTPAEVGADDETEAAATDEWDRAEPPEGKDGVTVTMQTRTAYNESGDETLYAYYRNFTYDSRGLLVSISAETRVTIDAPEECS